VEIRVPSEDMTEEERKKKEEDEKVPLSQRPHKGAPPVESHEDMTEEDRQLKEKLDNLAKELLEAQEIPKIEKLANDLRTEIRASTSSMTSVPKPLKFLRSHFADLKAKFESLSNSMARAYLADVLSVLAMTVASEELGCLKYRLVGSGDPLSTWGHEYIRYAFVVWAPDVLGISQGTFPKNITDDRLRSYLWMIS